jgi:hypothetical protein
MSDMNNDWKDDDILTTNFATIKQASNESFDMGVAFAEKTLIDKLRNMGTIRDSMLGDEWVVVYTEKGATDLPIKRLNTTP